MPCSLVKGEKKPCKTKNKTENVTLERIEWLVRRPVHGISVLIFRADGDSRSIQAADMFRQPGDSVLLPWRQRRQETDTQFARSARELLGNTPWTRLTDRDTRSLLHFLLLSFYARLTRDQAFCSEAEIYNTVAHSVTLTHTHTHTVRYGSQIIDCNYRF